MREFAIAAVVSIVCFGCTRHEPKAERPESEPPPQAAKADPKAVEILQRSAESYSKLRSYKDSIVIVSSGRNLMPRQAVGRTAFDRGGRMKFEVIAKDPYGPGTAKWAVSFEEGKVFALRSDAAPREHDGGLHEALMEIETASAHASVIIPSLLMPESFGGKTFFDQLVAPQLGQDLKLGDKSYYRITDQAGFGVVIDKSSFLVRRVLLPGGGMVDFSATPNATFGEVDWQ